MNHQGHPATIHIQIKYAPPFIPVEIEKQGHSPEEYVKNRENNALKQCMRAIARLMIEDEMKKISKHKDL
jgi:hypothetical protein